MKEMDESMEKRVLGISGIEVSEIGMGCMGLTHASGVPVPDDEGAKTIRAAYDAGYTFFDTAECYVGTRPDGTLSHNEDLVGKAFEGMRDEVVIATKFGVTHAPDKTLILDSAPDTIRASVEGSLKRLRTDYIDLYYQHRIDPKVEPEDVAETMAELIGAGKIRAWGISEASEEYLRRAHAVCPVSAVQNRFSMMARWHEGLFPVLEELGIAFIAFSPLGNGFLTGAYSYKTEFEGAQDYRADMPQYTEEGQRRAQPLVDLMRRIAADHDATEAQVALAWVLATKPYLIPIPGSRKVERLRQNASASELSLTAGEMQAINAELAKSDLLVFGGHKAR